MANAPELEIGNEFSYRAFLDLNGERQVGFTEGAIPWTAIHKYAEVYNLSEDDAQDLCFIVAHMDRAYLEWRRKKAEQEKTNRETAAKAKALNRGRRGG